MQLKAFAYNFMALTNVAKVLLYTLKKSSFTMLWAYFCVNNIWLYIVKTKDSRFVYGFNEYTT